MPHRIRLLCAYDPVVCAIVWRILVRAASGLYIGRAPQNELPRPNTGAVVFAQRFDSGLRLNLHFHGLWLDSVFACPLGSDLGHFDPHGELTELDVERLVRAIRSRVLCALQRHGTLPLDDDVAADAAPDGDPTLLIHLGAAAIEGRAVLAVEERQQIALTRSGERELFRRVAGEELAIGIARPQERKPHKTRRASSPASAVAAPGPKSVPWNITLPVGSRSS